MGANIHYKSRWYGLSVDFPDNWERAPRNVFESIWGRIANYRSLDRRAHFDISSYKHHRIDAIVSANYRVMVDKEARGRCLVRLLSEGEADDGESLNDNIRMVECNSIGGEDKKECNVVHVKYEEKIERPYYFDDGGEAVLRKHGGRLSVFHNKRFYTFEYRYLPRGENEDGTEEGALSVEEYEAIMQEIIDSIRFLR